MTPICITGADAPALHHLAQALQGAGVAPAQPLQRDAALDLHIWHQRVYQSGASPVVPSRLWEQVAIDLLLSNIDQPVWGWADARSVDALDFWAQLDTNIRFVLLCRTPQQAVADLFITNADTEADEARQLQMWQQRHQALLRFHLRHPERSVLVWADQARQAPHALATHLAQQWQLPLQPGAIAATVQPLPHNAVQLQLAAQLAARHPQYQELERELCASVQPLLAAEAAPAQDLSVASTAQQLVQSYLQLADRSAEQAQLDALAQTSTRTAADLQEAQQKGELLLQQLHQVQEELEKYYLNHQATQAEMQQLKAQLHATEEERNQAVHQRNLTAQDRLNILEQLKAADQASVALQARLDVLAEEQAQLVKARDVALTDMARKRNEAVHQRNLMAQDRQELIEKLKTTDEARAALQAQLDAHVEERAELIKARDVALTEMAQERDEAVHQRNLMAQDRQELIEKLQTLVAENAQTQAALQDTRQEGELLLQQLHQMQDELERITEQSFQVQAEHSKLLESEGKARAELQARLDAEIQATQIEVQVKAELQTQVDTLTAERAQLVLERDAALTAVAQERNEAVHQRNLIAQARLELVDELQATQQELERITQQLFQVQAELEQQHQREQAAQQLSQSLQARWHRLLEQQPELSDFDAVQLVGSAADGQPLQWRLNHTTVAGRAFERLDFQTVLENGVAGFVWQRHPSDGGSPLTRWPVSARSDDSITLIPTKSATDTHKRAAHMVQLASSDWELLLALLAVLMQALERGRVFLPAGQRDLWYAALARSAELMRGMQRLVRFDTTELTAQQATPQREVLALRLAPLHFAAMRLPEFTFQLQLNKAVDGTLTSAHFVLDAAAQGTALHNWVANVPTATGQAVMALRLDAGGWDAALWQQLTDQDRAFMSALLDSLAVVLVNLQAAGARAERAWADWLKLATRLRQWARVTPVPVVTTEEPAPAPAEMLQAPEAPPAAPVRPRRSRAKPKEALLSAPFLSDEGAPSTTRNKRAVRS